MYSRMLFPKIFICSCPFVGFLVMRPEVQPKLTTVGQHGATPKLGRQPLLVTTVEELPCLCEFRAIWISRFPNRQEFFVFLSGCYVITLSVRGARQS